MISFVKQGILTCFIVFFYGMSVSAEQRIYPPIQLVIETDQNTVYQHSQLIVTLHIFHDQPLPSVFDIIPPQLEDGQVRTLGMPYTRIEQGVEGDNFHTSQRFALFPNQPGQLLTLGPSVRLPQPFGENSFTLDTQIPSITVLPQKVETGWLTSEQLVLNDTTHPLNDSSADYLRSLTLTAIGTLANRLPDHLLNTEERVDYTLIERRTEEFHSRQGVTSQLSELWHIQSTSKSEESPPSMIISWWDTQTDVLKQLQYSGLNSLSETSLKESITQGALPENKNDITQSKNNSLIWGQIMVAVLLALLSISAGYFILFKRSQPADANNINTRFLKKHSPKSESTHNKMRNPGTETSTAFLNSHSTKGTEVTEQQAYRLLTQACHQNNCRPARAAIVLWAARLWPEHNIMNTESIYRANVSQTLNYLILDLDHHIKQSQEGAWKGDLLLEAVDTLRRRHL